MLFFAVMMMRMSVLQTEFIAGNVERKCRIDVGENCVELVLFGFVRLDIGGTNLSERS